jgi:ABC-type sulfate transport system substrate-binding protein
MSGQSANGGRDRRRFSTTGTIVLTVFLVVLLGLAIWRGRHGERMPPSRTITLYCFSALQEVMNEALLPAFQKAWQEETGERVEFITTFAGSGTITDRIIRRFPAEIAVLSSEVDAFRLVQNGVVLGPSWRNLPHQGVVSKSPLVILVRSGNPHGISAYADLGQDGLAVVHADPQTSGGGEWAILAVYGDVLRSGQSREEAAAQVTKVRGNVATQAASARAARSEFLAGSGDALITYEAEALSIPSTAVAACEVVRPPRTLVSEHVALTIGRNIDPEREAPVTAFLEFLTSSPAQDIFVRYGFRSIDEDRNRVEPALAAIDDPFSLSDLGQAGHIGRQIIAACWGEGGGRKR